jgi:CBS domain-containing protein
MARESNIELDVDRAGSRNGGEVARLVAARACGFTRDGGTPTLSEDCPTYAALEAEGQRLKGEIDAALEAARAHFAGSEAPEAEPRAVRRPEMRAAPKPRLDTDLAVRDVMTRNVRTVNRNDRLSVADELMKLGGFRHIVVVDDAGAVVGVVSSRDIFHGALAWSLGLGKAAHEKSLASYPVKQVMSGEVVTVPPGAPLREAAALMSEKKIGCMPVVEGRELVGIITAGDLLAILAGGEGEGEE